MELTEQIKQLISAYLDDETTPDETKQVEVLLKESEAAQKYFKTLKNVSTLLQSCGEESLSPDLERKIARRLPVQHSKEGTSMKTQVKFAVLALASFVIAFVISLNITDSVNRFAGRYRRNVDTSGEKYQIVKTAEKDLITAVEENTGRQFSFLEEVAPTEMKQEGKLASPKKDLLSSPEPPVENYRYQIQSTTSQIPQVQTRSRVQNGFIARDEGDAPGMAGMQASSLARGEMMGFSGRGDSIESTHDSVQGAPEVYRAGRLEEHKLYSEAEWTEPREDIQSLIYPNPNPYYPPPYSDAGNESYDPINEDYFQTVVHNPLSTFSLDVDTASYSNIRRFLKNGQMPPQDAVRIEEMLNYFTYSYPEPGWGQTFSIHTEVSRAPWNPQHDLVLVGLQAKHMKERHLPASHLIFLLDVSGSMSDPNKLPLLKQAFGYLVDQLRKEDRVSIVVYSGDARVVLEGWPGGAENKWKILQTINSLRAEGGTSGEAGLRLAYDVARQYFIRRGNNRIIVATDGDFNIGLSSDSDIARLIEKNRDDGVFLTVLGFGEGNLKDSKLEEIADKGNGQYAYIDSVQEAQKVLVEELGSTLYTMAKDVKIQVEFNPAQVKAYRLIGYENRKLAARDFNDDRKDAGDAGAGHQVTALYEIIPATSFERVEDVGALKYQDRAQVQSSDLLTLKLRYKEPKDLRSQLITHTLSANRIKYGRTSENFDFASAVAEFGLLLRNSEHKGHASYVNVLNRVRHSLRDDPNGHRAELLSLIETAQRIDPYNRVIGYPHSRPYPMPGPGPWYGDQPHQNPIQFKGQQ
jgi:Ca-activated chloride channel family protein